MPDKDGIDGVRNRTSGEASLTVCGNAWDAQTHAATPRTAPTIRLLASILIQFSCDLIYDEL